MKNMKLLIGIIIGMAVMYGISSAYNLNANLVTYDKKTTALESNTVSGAVNELGVLDTTSMSELKSMMSDISTKVNELYENMGNSSSSSGERKNFINLGTAKTIDVKALRPDVDYTSLTESNFIVESTSASATRSVATHDYQASNYQTQFNFSKSYNSSTGVLTITAYTYAYINFNQYAFPTQSDCPTTTYLVF